MGLLWGGGIIMFAVNILLWIAIFWGVIYAIRALNGGSRHNFPVHTRALAILDERYAKGEISKDEYLERKRDLLS